MELKEWGPGNGAPFHYLTPGRMKTGRKNGGLKTQINASLERCERCGEILTKSVHLEFSQTDGRYYRQIPEGHVSQGTFPFGVACAKKELQQQQNESKH